jgi:DNA-binding transcriptional MerR regulator
MTRSGDPHERLVVSVENAARELNLVAEELRAISDSLGRRHRDQARELLSVSTRLESLSGALGSEIMLGADGRMLRLLSAAARRALTIGVTATALVAGGVLEGVGGEAYTEFREREAAANASLDSLCDLVDELGDLPAPNHSSDEGRSSIQEAEHFSGAQAAALVGITYRQLDYWARTNLIRPSLTERPRARRLYSFSDLVKLGIVKEALDAGIRLEVLGRVMSEDLLAGQPSFLVLDGTHVTAVEDDDALAELVSGGMSAGVLNVLSVRQIVERLAGRVAESRNLE